jgi:hypothetical protein
MSEFDNPDMKAPEVFLLAWHTVLGDFRPIPFDSFFDAMSFWRQARRHRDVTPWRVLSLWDVRPGCGWEDTGFAPMPPRD